MAPSCGNDAARRVALNGFRQAELILGRDREIEIPTSMYIIGYVGHMGNSRGLFVFG